MLLHGYTAPELVLFTHLSEGHSPNLVEGALSEVGLPLYGVLEVQLREAERRSVRKVMSSCCSLLELLVGSPWPTLCYYPYSPELEFSEVRRPSCQAYTHALLRCPVPFPYAASEGLL